MNVPAGVIYPKLGRYRVTTGISLLYNFSKKSEGHDKARKGLYPQISAVQLTQRNRENEHVLSSGVLDQDG